MAKRETKEKRKNETKWAVSVPEEGMPFGTWVKEGQMERMRT
jgi:hypothetical protein